MRAPPAWSPESAGTRLLSYIPQFELETHPAVARLPSTGAGSDESVESTLSPARDDETATARQRVADRRRVHCPGDNEEASYGGTPFCRAGGGTDPLIYGLLDDVPSTQAFPVELFFDDAPAALERARAGDVAVVVLDLGWHERAGLGFCEGL